MAALSIYSAAPANLRSNTFFQPGAARTANSPTSAIYTNPDGTIVSVEAIGATFDGSGRPTGGTIQAAALYAADFTTQLAAFGGLSAAFVAFDTAWLGPGPTDVFALLLAGDDQLRGDDADDLLVGHLGADAINGGGGVNTAVFAGDSSLYTVGPAVGGISGIAGPDGSDTLENIQFLSFDDGIYALAPLGLGPVFSIEAAKTTEFEGTGTTSTATFTVLNTGGTAGTFTVDWTLAGSGANAADAADFTGGVLPSGSVTFNPGDTAKTITVAINGDTALEANEDFAVTLNQPLPGAVFATATATAFATILSGDSQVSIAALKASQAEGNDPFLAFTFKVTISGSTADSRTVAYTVAGATVPGTVAAKASDFAGGTFPTGTVTFTPGQVSQTLTVNVAGDTLAELNEAFAVTLSNPSPGTQIDKGTATGIILNDDTSFRIGTPTPTKLEGTGIGAAYAFTIQRAGTLTGTNSVSYGTVGAGLAPANAADFTGAVFPTGTVTFAPGETSKTIIIPIAGDSLIEPNEQFQLALSAPTGGAALIPGASTATGTIVNDDALLSLSATSSKKPEASSGGTTPFTFTVSRTGDTTKVHSANFAVTGAIGGGTVPATPADFAGGVYPTGTVAFAPGVTKQTVTINVNADKSAEFNERFAVTLSAPSSGAALGTKAAEGIIFNDDTNLSIAATSANKPEGTSTVQVIASSTPFTFTVTRSGITTAQHSAKWTVAGVSRTGTTGATANDFISGAFPSGTVTFAPGVTKQTITVNVSGDLGYETNETFSVTLSAPTGGAVISTPSAIGTITDDDAIHVTGTGTFGGSLISDTFLIGGTLLSTLLPGPSTDKFLFLPAFASVVSKTTIIDFAPLSGERLDLTRIDANPATLANDAFTYLGAGPFTGTPGELRWVVSAFGPMFLGDRNGNFAADFFITADANGLAPTSAWFLL